MSPTHDTKLRIPPTFQEALARTIVGAGGREVFFLARVFWSREGDSRVATLEEVEVVARGNAGAVPAIIEQAEVWDLAIHNHPGGNLEPSEADLSIAGELGSRNVGFAIISNDAASHYLVAGPFPRREAVPIDPEEVRAILSAEGPLARRCEGFETRDGQLDMAVEVTLALNENRVIAVEAGTGIGKSFAYLVPMILWAVRNGERVLVSTGTINLQEQLVSKDLPLLAMAMPVPFQFALAKGRGNYACLRKLHDLEADLREPTFLHDDRERRVLEDLVAWSRSTSEGSRADMSWVPAPAAWERIQSETDRSLKVSCEHYDDCFYYRAKRRASRANVIVANHHLYFADLSVRLQTRNHQHDGVLPLCRRVVFDEAHHLEDIAADYLGVGFSRAGVLQRLTRLVSPRDALKGSIPALGARLRRLGDSTAAEAIEVAFSSCVPEVTERIEVAFDEIERSVLSLRPAAGARDGAPAEDGTPDGEGAAGAGDPDVRSRASEGGRGAASGESGQARYRGDPSDEPIWSEVSESLSEIQRELSLVLRVTDRALESLERSTADPEKVPALALELTSTSSRLESLVSEIQEFREYADSTQVRWIAWRRALRHRARRVLEFGSAPIRVATYLKDGVYDAKRSVILTSATLSVAGKVDFLAERLGLSLLDPGRFAFREHRSPFDYPRQVLTVVPTDFPLPESPRFSGAVPEAVLGILRATRGRAFVLFTSYSLLRRTFEALERPLLDLGLLPAAQGDIERSELLRRFRSGAVNVLFGTDSFWEGVDVKGRALECVILTRLPFRVPSEPIQEARLEDLEARGVNPFTAFTVPQAVLKFKQGFGRLIRSSTDRGVVAILDRRILVKPYGRVFLRSLPDVTPRKAPLQILLREVESFFADDPAAEGGGIAANGGPSPGPTLEDTAAADAEPPPWETSEAPPW